MATRPPATATPRTQYGASCGVAPRRTSWRSIGRTTPAPAPRTSRAQPPKGERVPRRTSQWVSARTPAAPQPRATAPRTTRRIVSATDGERLRPACGEGAGDLVGSAVQHRVLEHLVGPGAAGEGVALGM